MTDTSVINMAHHAKAIQDAADAFNAAVILAASDGYDVRWSMCYIGSKQMTISGCNVTMNHVWSAL